MNALSLSEGGKLRVVAELLSRIGIKATEIAVTESFVNSTMEGLQFDDQRFTKYWNDLQAQGVLLPVAWLGRRGKMGQGVTFLADTINNEGQPGPKLDVLKKLMANQLHTVKDTVYLSLLLSLVRETLPLDPGRHPIVADYGPVDMRVVTQTIYRHSLNNFHTEDAMRYRKFLRRRLGETANLKGLHDLLHDGAHPQELVDRCVQIRAVTLHQQDGRNRGLTVAKGTLCCNQVFRDIYRSVGYPLSDHQYILNPGSVKLRGTGTPHLSFIAVSDRSTLRNARRTRRFKIHPQLVRWMHPRVQNAFYEESGWSDQVAAYAEALKIDHLPSVTTRLNGSARGELNLLTDTILDTELGKLAVSGFARYFRKTLLGVRVHGSAYLAASDPSLLLSCSRWRDKRGVIRVVKTGQGHELQVVPIKAPRKVGLKLGATGILTRAPNLTPGCVVPYVVVGFTEDQSVAINPWTWSWLLRGDFDGDRVLLCTEPWSDRLLTYLSSVMQAALDAYIRGEVTGVATIPRNEPISRETMLQMARGVFDAQIGQCDTLLARAWEGLHARGQTVTSSTIANFLQACLLIEAAIDTSKKRPVINGAPVRITTARVIKELVGVMGGPIPQLTWTGIRKSAATAYVDRLKPLDPALICRWDGIDWRSVVRKSALDSTSPQHQGELLGLIHRIADLTWLNDLLTKTPLTAPCRQTVVGQLVTAIGATKQARQYRPLRLSNGSRKLFDEVAAVLKTALHHGFSRWELLTFANGADEFIERYRQALTGDRPSAEKTATKRLLFQEACHPLMYLAFLYKASGWIPSRNPTSQRLAGKYLCYPDLMLRGIPRHIWTTIDARAQGRPVHFCKTAPIALLPAAVQ